MFDRYRRLSRTPELRAVLSETRLRASDLVYPIFVSESATQPEPIESLPGQFRQPLEALSALGPQLVKAGVKSILLFGLPKHKDLEATAAIDPNGIVPQAIRALKKVAPNLVVMTDVCVCAYMTHGHCGIVEGNEINNDASLVILARQAVEHAAAGADVVAPSSMMDGQVHALRTALDQAGFSQTILMAYSAKFTSAFYGPFREAAGSAPAFGDRSSYQHNPANLRTARLELEADQAEGADLLMVKPGLPYLDIVRLARETSDLPIVAYNVSGEYAMVKAASERGWLEERATVLEILNSFRRAGADLIITYHAVEAIKWLNDN